VTAAVVGAFFIMEVGVLPGPSTLYCGSGGVLPPGSNSGRGGLTLLTYLAGCFTLEHCYKCLPLGRKRYLTVHAAYEKDMEYSASLFKLANVLGRRLTTELLSHEGRGDFHELFTRFLFSPELPYLLLIE